MSAVLITLLLTFASLAGWDTDSPETLSYPLERFLPDQPGYTWSYWGFAEYGHRVQLDGMTRLEEWTVFQISGAVEDMSAGESSGDFTINLKYIVSENSLSMVQRASYAMDGDFPEMELLREPVEAGRTWTQTVRNRHGEEIELVCEIEEIEGNQVTVRYSSTDSPFYQLRVFEEGIGVVTFEKLFLSPDGNFEIGYTLFRGDY